MHSGSDPCVYWQGITVGLLRVKTLVYSVVYLVLIFFSLVSVKIGESVKTVNLQRFLHIFIQNKNIFPKKSGILKVSF